MRPSVLTRLLGLALLAGTLFSCTDSEPKPAGTVYIKFEGAIKSLNPYLSANSAYSRYAAQQIFQTLAINDPETFELKPYLIKTIPTARKVDSGPNAGCLAYDFEIWDEATWDNGDPITGNDVVFSLKLIEHPLLPTGIWRGYFENFKAIEVDKANPKKFTIFLTKYYILGLESMCQVPIYPPYNYDPDHALAKLSLEDLMDTSKLETIKKDPQQIAFSEAFVQPKFSTDPAHIAGSNAYVVENFDSDQGLTLVRKTNWWGDKVVKQNHYLAAYPEKLVYRVVRNDELVENMLKNNELDVALGVNTPKFLAMQQDTSLTRRYDFKTRWSPIYNRWVFNMRNPKLSDKRVRQALAQLVDYNYLIKTVAAGLAQRTVGMVPPSKPFYAKNIPPYQFNPTAARQLLAEAGWTDTDGDGIVDKVIDGVKVPLDLSVNFDNSGFTGTSTANSLVETMRQAGVKITLAPLEISMITKNTRSGDFETALFAAFLYPGLVDFEQYYHSHSMPPAGDNRSGLSNPELDKVIEAIRTTEDESERNKLYVRAQEIIYDESPEIFLFVPDQRYIVSKRFDYVISSNRPGFYEQYFKLK